MRRSYRLLLILAGVSVLAAAWLWWNRPRPVDLATYAPADTLVYLEANDLAGVLGGLTSTDAWRELAPHAGVRTDMGKVGRLSRLAAWTGLGSAETVVLARAQVAVVVLGFETVQGADSAPTVRPRLAVVAETHTGEGRSRAAVEKLVGGFARGAFGRAELEHSERGGAKILVWSQPGGARKIHAAVLDGFVAVGTDDAAVRACLAVRRGEQGSLADDPQLASMRERVGAGGALAFGFVPAAAVPKLSEIAALFFAGRLSPESEGQSALAVLVPQLTAKLLGGAAWSSRVVESAVEDRYFVSMPENVSARLAVALETPREQTHDAAALLPSDLHQLTRYSFTEPGESWRGVNAVVSSQLDFTLAPLAGRYLDQMLEPFIHDAPRELLRAVGPELTTARLDREGEHMLLVARVRDEAALRALLRRRFGAGARASRVGDAEMITSPDEGRGAAAFAAGHFISGDAEGVRRCLQARADGRTADKLEALRRAAGAVPAGAPAQALTFADEREYALGFLSLVARQRGARQGTADAAALSRAAAALPFSVSETRLAGDGFERRTRSSFGQLGALALRFASDSGVANAPATPTPDGK